MALIGISVSDSFDYVSDDDPCKHKRARTIAAPDGGPPVLVPGEHDEIIEEGATKFRLGVLDVFLMGMIYDKSTTFERSSDETSVKVHTNINATNIEAVRYGLKGWESFRDVAGNDLKFETVDRSVMGRDYKCASDNVLKLLGNRLISELANKIKTASEVGKAEAKNSATA